MHTITIKKFFEENDRAIIYKLQKIFYILEIENGKNEIFNIDRLLLYSQQKDNSIFSSYPNLNDEWNEKTKIPLIKFELILIYYSLFMLYHETILEKYNIIENKSKEYWERFYIGFYSNFNMILEIIFSPLYAVQYLFCNNNNYFSPKKNKLQEIHGKAI